MNKYNRQCKSRKAGNTIYYSSTIKDSDLPEYIELLEREIEALNLLTRGLRDELKCAKEYLDLCLNGEDKEATK